MNGGGGAYIRMGLWLLSGELKTGGALKWDFTVYALARLPGSTHHN